MTHTSPAPAPRLAPVAASFTSPSSVTTTTTAIAGMLLAALLTLAAYPTSASAQLLGWDVETEANASLFFGNTSQRLAALRSGISRADSGLAVSTGLRFTYADVTAEDGERTVNRRSWAGTVNIDHRPFARYSPFFFGTAESSFEQRIASRVAAGLGAKVTFLRTDDEERSFSLAMLAENTRPSDGRTLENPTLARWSARLRLRRKFDDRLSASHVTFYRPAVTNTSDFTFTSTTALAAKLNEVLSFTVSLIDNYDSQARARGARTNNDGQVLLGILTTF